MNIVEPDNLGNISADAFLSKIDIHVSHTNKETQKEIEDKIFMKIKSFMDHSHASLYELMQAYDPEYTGLIPKNMVQEAFKKLRVTNLTKEQLETIMKAGGVGIDEHQINYDLFCKKFTMELNRRLGLQVKRSHEIIRKLSAVLKTRNISIFECFCIFDVNLSTELSKLELKTGIMNLGLEIDPKDYELLWKALRKGKDAKQQNNVASV
jgi:Ca2+-binding EF-hand superfamily protein